MLHVNASCNSVPHRGSLQGCGGHAVRSAGAQSDLHRHQDSSQVRKYFYFCFTLSLLCHLLSFLVAGRSYIVICTCLSVSKIIQDGFYSKAAFHSLTGAFQVLTYGSLFPSQGSERDQERGGAALWADGGRVSGQRGSDGENADDGVCDTKVSQDKHPSEAAGEVQGPL